MKDIGTKGKRAPSMQLIFSRKKEIIKALHTKSSSKKTKKRYNGKTQIQTKDTAELEEVGFWTVEVKKRGANSANHAGSTDVTSRMYLFVVKTFFSRKEKIEAKRRQE